MFCKLPCARPKPAYRQTAHPVRRWTGTGNPTYDPPSDPRWKATPVYRYNVYPAAPVYVPTTVPVYVPTPVCVPTPVLPCKIEPVYPFLQANKFDLFNPPTRTKLPRYHFPKVSQPQPYFYPPPYPPPPPYSYPYPHPYPPPFPRESGSKAELHPMLALHEHPAKGPNIQWLLFDDPSRYITWDIDCPLSVQKREQVTLHQEAVYPSSDVNRIQINYSQHSHDLVDFSIPRKHAHLPLTVGDVLQGMFSHFMTALSQDELEILSKNQSEENMAFGAKHRRTHLRPGSYETRDSIRRIDTLGDRTRFGGLQVQEVRDGTLFLNLKLLPGQTKS